MNVMRQALYARAATATTRGLNLKVGVSAVDEAFPDLQVDVEGCSAHPGVPGWCRQMLQEETNHGTKKDDQVLLWTSTRTSSPVLSTVCCAGLRAL